VTNVAIKVAPAHFGDLAIAHGTDNRQKTRQLLSSFSLGSCSSIWHDDLMDLIETPEVCSTRVRIEFADLRPLLLDWASD